MTQSPQMFHWEGYGLKLQIPPQALPAHMTTCTITITASLSGQYQFPSNVSLVSPVFWLRCRPTCRFKVPLHLHIQHCAPVDKSFRLFMARALCTQKDLPYYFRIIHGSTFSEHSSYGVVALDSFSGVGVVQEKSRERRYWSKVFYMGPAYNRTIHFAVTWHNAAHITVSIPPSPISSSLSFAAIPQTVQNFYTSRKASLGPGQSIVFKDDKISLDVPKDGQVVHKEWKIFPTKLPKVRILARKNL